MSFITRSTHDLSFESDLLEQPIGCSMPLLQVLFQKPFEFEYTFSLFFQSLHLPPFHTFSFPLQKNDFNLLICAYSQFTLPNASCQQANNHLLFLSKELIPGFLIGVLFSLIFFFLAYFLFFLLISSFPFSLKISSSYCFPNKLIW